MQLESKMKQRFSWTALLLLTACLVHSSLATLDTDGKTCKDSVGIIGKFAQDDEKDSLTITPIEYTKTLEVKIGQTVPDDRGIQIYMVLDKDSVPKCPGGFFDIVHPTNNVKCSFKYKVSDKLTITDKSNTVLATLGFDYADPYQASFEVQVQNSGAASSVNKLVVQTSSGDSYDYPTAEQCLAFTDKFTNFTFSFPDKMGTMEDECGVQFEMKGAYEATKLTMDTNDCRLEPGYSNDDAPGNEDTTIGPSAQPTTEPSFPTWAWYVIGGVGGLILIVIIGLLVFFFCIRKKKGSADEDAEAAEEEPDLQPTESTTTGPGAEPSGVDPTQQNEDKSEDKSENKPDDKPEDKPEDE